MVYLPQESVVHFILFPVNIIYVYSDVSLFLLRLKNSICLQLHIFVRVFVYRMVQQATVHAAKWHHCEITVWQM